MSKNYFQINNNVASRLDWAIDGKGIPPKRGQFLWGFYKERTYARNSKKNDPSFYVAFSLFFVLAFLFFHFIPFLYLGTMALVTFTIGIWWAPIHSANNFLYGGFISIVLGAIGLYFHVDLGLHIFSLELNHYFFYGFIISGVLAIYRRFWNAFIWAALDRYVLRYYKINKISTDMPPEYITDFKAAYLKLSNAVGELMHERFNQPDALGFLKDQTLEHFNHVIDLIEKEVSK